METKESINICITGILGRMGSFLMEYYKSSQNDSINLLAGVGRQNSFNGIPIYSNLIDCIKNHNIDVLVDFSTHPVSLEFVVFALENGINVVSGTTGYSKADLNMIKKIAKKNKRGVIISPNFSLGGIIIAKFLEEYHKYFDQIEIIESHNITKKDIPSGTAIVLNELCQNKCNNIHSIRLPGIIAEHQIILADGTQIIEIKHKTLNRDSFIRGINYAINDVYNNKSIKVGIENIIKE